MLKSLLESDKSRCIQAKGTAQIRLANIIKHAPSMFECFILGLVLIPTWNHSTPPHTTSNFPMTFDKPLSESSSLTIRSVRGTEIRTKEFETNATSSAPSYHPLGSCCVWRDEQRPRQREGKRIELRKTRIPVFQLTRVLMGQIEKWRCHRSRGGRDRWWLEIACVWLQMSTFQTRIR